MTQKIFADAVDVNVINRVLYTDASDTHLFIDKECTIKAVKDEVLNAAYKGLVVEYISEEDKPTALNVLSFKDEGSYASVVVADYNRFSTLYSAEKE